MNSYNKYKHFSVPNEIFKLDLDNEVLIDLIKLLSFTIPKVPIRYITGDINISRLNVKELNSKSIITISEDNGEVVIDLTPFYNKIYMAEDSIKQLEPSLISTAALERISFLLERKIKPIEIDKVNTWLAKGYTTENIEVAVHKSALNNVDNFSYIETVLFNNNETNVAKKNTVTRNIDLY